MNWHHPTTEPAAIGTYTHHVSECGCYRVTLIDHGTSDSYAPWHVACRLDAGRWLYVGAYGRRYRTIDAALRTCERHQRAAERAERRAARLDEKRRQRRRMARRRRQAAG